MEQFNPYSPPSDPAPSPGPHDDWEKVARIKDLFYRARSARRPLLTQWTANYEALHNRVWAAGRPAWMPSPSVAEIYPTVASIVAWQSDASPSFDVVPYADPNSPYHEEMTRKASDLRTALQANWLINSADTEIQKALWDTNVYGTGIIKSVWDSHLADGAGDAAIRRVDPFWFYPDPDATSLDDARYIVECYELSDDAIEERFPGALDKLGAGVTEDVDRAPTLLDNPRGSAPKANLSAVSPGTSTSFSPPGSVRQYSEQVDSNRHTVLECWYRCNCGDSEHDKAVRASLKQKRRADAGGITVQDLDVLEKAFGVGDGQVSPDAPGQPEQPEQTPAPSDPSDPFATVTPEMMGQAPVDPATAPDPTAATPPPSDTEIGFTPTSHWHVTVISAATVLMDCPVDRVWSHGRHPYDRMVAVDEGEFWGQSLVELLTPPQKSINWLASAIEQNIWLAGNPVFIEDNRSNLQRTRVTNKPGTRLTVGAGSEAKWLNPPQIHPQLGMQLIQFYTSEIERISGLSAIVRGATPSGRNSQGVLDSVQEAAFVRIRLALRNLETCLRSAGQKMASLIAEFYDTPRIVAVVGPAGDATIKTLSELHFYDGQTPLKFQLNIQAGSTLSTSRSARIAEADTLYAMQAIDSEALLSAHDFPNWPTVVARMREMQAAAGGPIDPGPNARAAAGRTS